MKLPTLLAGLLALVLTPSCASAATTYYVGQSPAASDSNSGKSPDSPFRTPQRAADAAQPGDTIYIMDGVYTNSNPDGYVLNIANSGRSTAWIRFDATARAHPIFRSSGWAAIKVDASYIEIRGLDLQGTAKTVPLAEAQAHSMDGSDVRTNNNGISIDGRSDGNHKPHHIVIDECVISDFPGGGIAVCQADYITAENNLVFDNSWYSPYSTSGISLWQCWNYDDAPGYHNRIVRNECFGNANLVPNMFTKTFTDGNGIILDDSKNTQNGSTLGPYRGRTLIANNLCYENGGSGIHTYSSEHADIVNNTCIDNNRTPAIDEGQTFPNASDDVKFLNNILVGPKDKLIDSNWNDSDVTWDYNLLWGGEAKITGPHDITADPDITIERVGDRLVIHMDPHSPAVGSGDRDVPIRDDLFGHPRPRGKPIDRGCVQVG